jgi:carbonic anhydrase
LGHARCGGVKAFAEDGEPLTPGDFIGKWMSLMAPAAEKVGPRGDRSESEYLTALEQANVALSLENLMTFPRLRERVERGELMLHGAYFGVATGKLSVRDRATGQFVQVATEDHARLFATPRF